LIYLLQKKEQVTIDAALGQGLPKCRYSHGVSSQPGYMEVRQKRCTHTREAIIRK